MCTIRIDTYQLQSYIKIRKNQRDQVRKYTFLNNFQTSQWTLPSVYLVEDCSVANFIGQ